MKALIRSFILHAAALYLADFLLPGVSLTGGGPTLALAGGGLALFNLLLRPLLNLLFLPINLLTLGAFRGVINILILYLLTLVVPQLKIKGFFFPGFVYQDFSLPDAYVSQFWSLVIASLVVSLGLSFLYWAFEE